MHTRNSFSADSCMTRYLHARLHSAGRAVRRAVSLTSPRRRERRRKRGLRHPAPASSAVDSRRLHPESPSLIAVFEEARVRNLDAGAGSLSAVLSLGALLAGRKVLGCFRPPEQKNMSGGNSRVDSSKFKGRDAGALQSHRGMSSPGGVERDGRSTGTRTAPPAFRPALCRGLGGSGLGLWGCWAAGLPGGPASLAYNILLFSIVHYIG